MKHFLPAVLILLLARAALGDERVLHVAGAHADGSSSRLTGFVVHSTADKCYCLTNNHLFRERVESLRVGIPGEKWCPARLIRRDSNYDLALLEFEPGRQLVECQLDDECEVGELGTLFGYAGGGPSHHRRGSVLRVDERVAVLSCPSFSGESGSPIFTTDSRVCAINWGSNGQTLCATPVGPIRRFLRQCAPRGFCQSRQCEVCPRICPQPQQLEPQNLEPRILEPPQLDQPQPNMRDGQQSGSPPGPPGPPGPQGRPGPVGPAGPPGRLDDEALVKRITEEVVRQLRKEAIDPDQIARQVAARLRVKVSE